jgi:preprotein translocase subunit YajC
MIRPQSKKQKAKQKMLQGLQPGDEVITIGGIIGKIEGTKEKDNTLILRIDKDVKINISRTAIADKINK